jgi:inorganic pyrophosphatase
VIRAAPPVRPDEPQGLVGRIADPGHDWPRSHQGSPFPSRHRLWSVPSGVLASLAGGSAGFAGRGLDLHSDDADAPSAMSPSPDDFPAVVEVVVEIPRGSRNKYEYDEAADVFRLDRVLASAVHYNFDYGFISGTRAGDGDHTDALLLIDEPTFPGCRVWARPIGGLEMRDDKGEDFKVLCVAVADPHQAHVEDLDHVRPHRLIEIEHFFNTYKLLEAKATDVMGWRNAARARAVLVADRATWQAEASSGSSPHGHG